MNANPLICSSDLQNKLFLHKNRTVIVINICRKEIMVYQNRMSLSKFSCMGIFKASSAEQSAMGIQEHKSEQKRTTGRRVRITPRAVLTVTGWPQKSRTFDMATGQGGGEGQGMNAWGPFCSAKKAAHVLITVSPKAAVWRVTQCKKVNSLERTSLKTSRKLEGRLGTVAHW